MKQLIPPPDSAKPQKKRKVKPGTNPEHIGHICLLINSVHFFLHSVFILCQENIYRLVVLHNNHLLIDRHYNTMRGARIAFQKLFKHKAWQEGVKSNWSLSYPPDTDWLEEKTALLTFIDING
jgi:hypothetical protein